MVRNNAQEIIVERKYINSAIFIPVIYASINDYAKYCVLSTLSKCSLWLNFLTHIDFQRYTGSNIPVLYYMFITVRLKQKVEHRLSTFSNQRAVCAWPVQIILYLTVKSNYARLYDHFNSSFNENEKNIQNIAFTFVENRNNECITRALRTKDKIMWPKTTC